MEMGDGVLYIAELSANHNGSFERAQRLVESAASAGASAIKLQTYKPETMTLNNGDFKVSDEHKLWGGMNLYKLYADAMTPWAWHESLFKQARRLGLVPFSSPFDRSAVDFLESIDCPMYKIASLETGDVDLISYVAATGKPIIISTGATELEEVEAALDAAKSGGCKDVTLLLCTSAYPAEPKDAHLSRINSLKNKFKVKVGLSDHTLGISVSLAAIALGATVIEKHLTLSRSDGGYDSQFSLEPSEFRELVEEGRIVEVALGDSTWNIKESERESRRLRRSLYIVRNVKKGELASRDNIKSLRPNLGGPIADLDFILGKRFKDNFELGTSATVNCVE